MHIGERKMSVSTKFENFCENNKSISENGLIEIINEKLKRKENNKWTIKTYK